MVEGQMAPSPMNAQYKLSGEVTLTQGRQSIALARVSPPSTFQPTGTSTVKDPSDGSTKRVYAEAAADSCGACAVWVGADSFGACSSGAAVESDSSICARAHEGIAAISKKLKMNCIVRMYVPVALGRL
jgi:hypothetical protein